VRKTAITLGTSVFVFLVTALPALADSSLPEPGGPSVLGESGQAGGGTAFTGATLAPLMIAFAVVVVVGLSLLAYRQRRTATN
jgi:hypothetical protein